MLSILRGDAGWRVANFYCSLGNCCREATLHVLYILQRLINLGFSRPTALLVHNLTIFLPFISAHHSHIAAAPMPVADNQPSNNQGIIVPACSAARLLEGSAKLPWLFIGPCLARAIRIITPLWHGISPTAKIFVLIRLRRARILIRPMLVSERDENRNKWVKNYRARERWQVWYCSYWWGCCVPTLSFVFGIVIVAFWGK